MATCFKTGAYIRLAEYDAYAPADLYKVGNCVVVHFVPAGVNFKANLRPVSHEVRIDIPPSFGYYNDRLGILVVPENHITTLIKELPDAPPT